MIENKEKCKICNGEGHIIFKGYTISCPECEGRKGSKLTYMIDGKLFERKKVGENEIFPTQEEAETRCNELNKEVTANGNR